MSPSHGSKGKRKHRYYVSQALLQHRPEQAGSVPRLPAHGLEQVVAAAVVEHLKAIPAHRLWTVTLEALPERERHAELRRIVRRVTVHPDHVAIQIVPGVIAADMEAEADRNAVTLLEQPFKTLRSKGSTLRVVPQGAINPSLGKDTALIKALIKAYAWREQLLSGKCRRITDIAAREGISDRYVSRLLRLGFLAPDLMQAILDGRQPPALRLEAFRKPIPLDWAEQRRYFDFTA